MTTFHVVAVKNDGKAMLVMLRKGEVSRMFSMFTVWRALAKDQSGDLTSRQAAAALKWAKKKGWKARVVKHDFPFLMKEDGVKLPGDVGLLRRLNRVGREMKRFVIIKSGYRGNHEQWVLRQRYLRGEGNLAARCCLKYNMEPHSWEQCGKASQSNHSQPPKGHAVDCGLAMPQGYVSIGLVSKARRLMRKFGLCLPVGNGEVWHVEVGSTWVS